MLSGVLNWPWHRNARSGKRDNIPQLLPDLVGAPLFPWCTRPRGTGCPSCFSTVVKPKPRLKDFQYDLLIFSQILQNSLDGASQCRWTMTQSILRKQPKSFFKANKWNVMQWPSQSPNLNPIEHAFHLLKTKLKGKCPKNKQELKTVAVEAW